MANVLSRNTPFIYLQSVNTPEYPDSMWVINPDMSAVQGTNPRYWVLNTDDTVRNMTDEEKSAYDAANPVTLYVNTLNDGTPAYNYAPMNMALSVEQASVQFGVQTPGAKNFYLPYLGVTGSTSGFLVPKNAVMKTLSATFRAPVGAQVDLHFRQSGGTDLFVVQVPAGSKSQVFINQVFTISAGTILSCYLNSTAQVQDPVVVCSLGWTN